MRPALSVAFCLTVLAAAAVVRAEGEAGTADDLLAEGYRLYSEDLEFEQAADAFEQVAEMAGATDAQRLEALEYLTACRYALEDLEGARSAIEQMLRIDPEGTLHDPSLPPDLLDLVEEVRASMPPLPPESPELPEVEVPPGLRDVPPDEGPEEGGGRDGPGPGLEEYYPDRPTTPWYRTWWFWTITGAVVVAGVTTAIVLAVPGGEAEPPAGSLDPGRVQLPCAGIPF